jgi:acyl-CoA synthetase (AMP-forming)/AMP-acid ligase II
MDLHALNIMTQGGGKLNKDLQVKFANYISSKDGRYIATYGQTEGSARMAYLPAEYAVSKVGSIGKAIPNGKLYLLDENNSVIATPNTEGEMVYEGPNVTLGYAESGEDLIKGDERHGILRTGDLAYFDEDGFFYISGRMKRFLKLFGYRVNLDDCESLVRKEFGIGCACVGDDSRLVICIDKEGIEAEVKSYIVHKTGLYATSVEVVYIDELPRSDAGKILYSEISKKVMG